MTDRIELAWKAERVMMLGCEITRGLQKSYMALLWIKGHHKCPLHLALLSY